MVTLPAMQANEESFSQHVPGDYKDYCNTMDKLGTWGDHITLQVGGFNRVVSSMDNNKRKNEGLS